MLRRNSQTFHDINVLKALERSVSATLHLRSKSTVLGFAVRKPTRYHSRNTETSGSAHKFQDFPKLNGRFPLLSMFPLLLEQCFDRLSRRDSSFPDSVSTTLPISSWSNAPRSSNDFFMLSVIVIGNISLVYSIQLYV